MSPFKELPEADQQLAQSLQAGLRASEELDYVTASRLRAARARAVAAARRPARGGLYASGGLTAAAIVAAVLLLQAPHLSQVAAPPFPESGAGTQADALDVLTDEVDADFYEDLDLYRWLARSHDGDA